MDSQSRSGFHIEYWSRNLHNQCGKEAIEIDKIDESVDKLVLVVSDWELSSISVEQWHASDTSAHQTGHYNAIAEIGM